MSSTPITIRSNGSMTLPKKFRDDFKTVHFMAIKMDDGVMLRPIREEIEYYEEKDGSFGVRFPRGIEMNRLLSMIKEANDKLDREEAMKKKHRRKKIR